MAFSLRMSWFAASGLFTRNYIQKLTSTTKTRRFFQRLRRKRLFPSRSGSRDALTIRLILCHTVIPTAVNEHAHSSACE